MSIGWDQRGEGQQNHEASTAGYATRTVARSDLAESSLVEHETADRAVEIIHRAPPNLMRWKLRWGISAAADGFGPSACSRRHPAASKASGSERTTLRRFHLNCDRGRLRPPKTRANCGKTGKPRLRVLSRALQALRFRGPAEPGCLTELL